MADAQAHCHRQAVAGAPSFGTCLDALEYLVDGGLVALRQERDELVASPASAHTHFGRFVEDLRKFGQHAVTHAKTETNEDRQKQKQDDKKHRNQRTNKRLVENGVCRSQKTVAVEQ